VFSTKGLKLVSTLRPMNEQHNDRRSLWFAASISVCTIWPLFAFGVVSGLIAAAYHGQSASFFNKLIRGQSVHSLEHYIEYWRVCAWAIELGLAVASALALTLPPFLQRLVESATAPRPELGRLNDARIILGVSSLLLVATAVLGSKHDYNAYLREWALVQAGDDPWTLLDGKPSASNNYGPLFNVLAAVALVNPLLPKILFSCAWIALAWSCAALWKVNRDSASGPGAWVVLALLLGPFMWVETVAFGHFDSLVAAALLVSLLCSRRGQDHAAGISLGTGILLKFIPILALPFLAIDHGRLRSRLAVATVLTGTLGMALGVAAWGVSTFVPLAHLTNRLPNGLSIYVFMNTFLPALNRPERASSVLVATSLVAVFTAYLRQWLDQGSALVLLPCLILAFGKMGFPQYHVYLFFAFPLWAATRSGLTWLTSTSLFVYAGWISLFNLWYWRQSGLILEGNPAGKWNALAGLPTFLILLLLITSVVHANHKKLPRG